MGTVNDKSFLPDAKPPVRNGLTCAEENEESGEDIITVWPVNIDAPMEDGDECEHCGSDDTTAVFVFRCDSEGTVETGCHDPDTHDFGFDGHAEPE